MESKPATGPVDPLRRLQAASANYQQTARWLAGSFGALGVALVAGLSLSGLGGLEWWRLGFAIGGVALALASVLLVIYQTALVVPIEYMTFEEVDVASGEGEAEELLRTAIVSHDGLFPPTFEHRTPAKLRRHIFELETALKHERPSEERAGLEADLAQSREAANAVLAFANHYEARRAYERLRQTVLVGALTFVVGAVLFAWASNPGPDPPAPITVIVQDSPTTTQQP